MDARQVAALLSGTVLLIADLSLAGNPGPVEPLDGLPSATTPRSRPLGGAEGPLLSDEFQATPRVNPRGRASPEATTPFDTPLPPNQLTPPPVLPFHPNRSLMPSSSNPPSSPGSGRLGH